MEYNQIIKVPETLSPSLFNLSCVHDVSKCQPEGLSYTIDAISPFGNIALKAYPGDYLCQQHNGTWVRISSWDSMSIEELNIQHQ